MSPTLLDSNNNNTSCRQSSLVGIALITLPLRAHNPRSRNSQVKIVNIQHILHLSHLKTLSSSNQPTSARAMTSTPTNLTFK